MATSTIVISYEDSLYIGLLSLRVTSKMIIIPAV
jgi:hypothetical protein